MDNLSKKDTARILSAFEDVCETIGYEEVVLSGSIDADGRQLGTIENVAHTVLATFKYKDPSCLILLKDEDGEDEAVPYGRAQWYGDLA
jgi:hypothetical protein